MGGVISWGLHLFTAKSYFDDMVPVKMRGGAAMREVLCRFKTLWGAVVPSAVGGWAAVVLAGCVGQATAPLHPFLLVDRLQKADRSTQGARSRPTPPPRRRLVTPTPDVPRLRPAPLPTPTETPTPAPTPSPSPTLEVEHAYDRITDPVSMTAPAFVTVVRSNLQDGGFYYSPAGTASGSIQYGYTTSGRLAQASLQVLVAVWNRGDLTPDWAKVEVASQSASGPWVSVLDHAPATFSTNAHRTFQGDLPATLMGGRTLWVRASIRGDAQFSRSGVIPGPVYALKLYTR